MSSYGGMGGGMSGGMAAKPPPLKTKPKKGAASSGGGIGEILGNPLVLKVVGGIAAVAVLVVGYLFMPAGTGREKQQLVVLQKVLTDFRELRKSGADAAAFDKFAKETGTIVKPLIDELKGTANRQYPARQYLLWAAKDRLPGMLSTCRDGPKFDEEEFDFNLQKVAFLTGTGPTLN
jgi:hypothetical protein